MRKWDPPFLTHVSVSYEDDESAEVAAKASTTTNEADPTFKAASCTFGFLFPIRFFNDLIASLGWTLFDRMTSEISRVSARSSLIMCCISLLQSRVFMKSMNGTTYKLDEEARSICSSSVELEANQPAMMPGAHWGFQGRF